MYGELAEDHRMGVIGVQMLRFVSLFILIARGSIDENMGRQSCIFDDQIGDRDHSSLQIILDFEIQSTVEPF